MLKRGGFSGITPDATNKIGVNPLFISNFNNMHLQAGSPARNNRTTITSVTNDYDGISRPQGSAWDIGAYEYY